MSGKSIEERVAAAVDSHNEAEEPFAPVHCNSGDDCHLRLIAALRSEGVYLVTEDELRRMRRSAVSGALDEALNSGDGVYRP